MSQLCYPLSDAEKQQVEHKFTRAIKGIQKSYPEVTNIRMRIQPPYTFIEVASPKHVGMGFLKFNPNDLKLGVKFDFSVGVSIALKKALANYRQKNPQEEQRCCV